MSIGWHRWCHTTISSSVVPFSSCFQSFPASGSFPVSQLFVSGGQSIGASASASVLMNIQGCFPCGSARKEFTCNAGDLGLITGLGKSPGEGKGYPFQYSGLENSLDCIVHGVAKSWTQLSDFHFTSQKLELWLVKLNPLKTNLDSILKSRDITLLTKVPLVKAIIFPVVMYGYESWTIKKAKCQRIDAFELWCWRRLLRVPWTTWRSN